MKTIFMPLFFALALSQVQAQSVRIPVGAPYTGSGAYSKKFADVFSCASNQAALPEMPGFSAGIYSENRFLAEGLHFFLVSMAFKAGGGAMGLNARYFGNALFNESQAGIAYGKSLGPVNVGVQFNYHAFAAAGSGSAGLVNVELGAIWHLTDKIHTGLHIFNPAGGRFGYNKQEKLASSFRVGFGFEASSKTYFSIDVNKTESQTVNVFSMVRYVFAGKFFAVMGLASATAQPFISAGWSWKDYRADLTGMYHWQLGWSPGLLFIYQPKKNNP